jgi:adenylate cyclase, class 1
VKNGLHVPLQNAMRNPAREWTLRDPKQRDLENRFAAVTQTRLRRVFDALLPRQQDLVAVLPVLFHLNHPSLPGYIGHDTPCGIADYSATRTAVTALGRLVKTFNPTWRGRRQLDIKGLYLMGSAGTIAYARDSDLDVWVCHDPALGAAAIEKLVRKAQRLEAFAQTHGLEIHFYVFNAERFKRGESLSLSAESSGSSQHYLLLDEFYRSGLLLAGLKPLWWLVPVSDETGYDDYVDRAFRQRQLSPHHYVDFGGLPTVPPSEFFGAALWQLYKSIESPYKSVMKLLLMETYAAEYPAIRLLSHRYKAMLSSDTLVLDDLDPYLSMYRKIEEYLRARDDLARLRLLRRAFYLKTSEQLSRDFDPKQQSWRRSLLTGLVESWGWSAAEIAALDSRHAWHIDIANDERRELIKALQRSYSVLSEFARRHGDDQLITKRDLNILGRKLYAAFEKKPHKLELITRGICQNPIESELSVLHVPGDLNESHWSVYGGCHLEKPQTNPAPLKQGSSLVEILSWCYFNRLADSRTRWHLVTNGQRSAPTQLRRILGILTERYASQQPWTSTIDDFARPARAKDVSFFVNIGCEVNPGRLTRGDILTSSYNDAFRFGGAHQNLVIAIDALFGTTWGELYCYRHTGDAALLNALCAYLDRSAPGSLQAPSIYCFTPDYGQLIFERVAQYLREICRRWSALPAGTVFHHIVAVGDTFHEIYRRERRAESRIHTHPLSLFNALGEPSPSFRQVEFDANCAHLTPLAAIYRHNQAARIQIFAYQHAAKLDIYVLDEFGDLYVERQLDQNLELACDRFRQFFAEISPPPGIEPSPTVRANVEFHELRPSPSGWQVQPVVRPTYHPAINVLLQIHADLEPTGRAEFTCVCDRQEFRSGVYGTGFFGAIANTILAARQYRERYPVYITRLSLSDRYAAAFGPMTRRTVRLLELKKRIEYQLTNALRDKLDPPAISEPRKALPQLELASQL